ncbi:PREDICTED: putative transcription factor bHLH086 [Nelumbo nucifera]|uniref:BHLH domain-containing protein n=2 Tax=Nelumbo nucifera TaxID=4432 RepID=A0A822YIT5_NELNU|nr:PREDICTED: putative transcription factor bHLH086 [Nelumbo nucifera]DAD32033.1 TPA_asm: hypothetical protein HUJ06_010884 [Nelumbo nucifera]
MYGGSPFPFSDSSSLPFFGFINNYHEAGLEEEEGSNNTSGSTKDTALSSLPSLSDLSKENSRAYVFGITNSPPEEAQSIINFRTSYDNSACPSESFLSFEQGERVPRSSSRRTTDDHEDGYSIWIDSTHLINQCQWHQSSSKSAAATDSRLSAEDLNCYGLKKNTEGRFGWLYSTPIATAENVDEEYGGSEARFLKRPYTGGEMQAVAKKHWAAGSPWTPKPKSSPPKDSQSIAAKNRREKISERLKILQDLIPNGAKVDLVTMLEKAISYVKFLQLQVKVLATDEFWPVQGGKDPEVGQVKEAIDAILSSHGLRNSSSKEESHGATTRRNQIIENKKKNKS